MVCSRCTVRHWFSTVHTNPQVKCPQCRKPTTFNKLVEGDTRSGPLGTGKVGRLAGQEYANARNLEEAFEEEGGGGGGGDGAGPSNAADPEAGARRVSEQAERRRREQAEKAAAEDVEVEVLSQQLRGLASPSKPAEKRQKMRDGSS
jgi:hypothetical protein